MLLAPIETGDTLLTMAGYSRSVYAYAPVSVDHKLEDGDLIQVGDLELEVWHTRPHRQPTRFSYRRYTAKWRQHLS